MRIHSHDCLSLILVDAHLLLTSSELLYKDLCCLKHNQKARTERGSIIVRDLLSHHLIELEEAHGKDKVIIYMPSVSPVTGDSCVRCRSEVCGDGAQDACI